MSDAPRRRPPRLPFHDQAGEPEHPQAAVEAYRHEYLGSLEYVCELVSDEDLDPTLKGMIFRAVERAEDLERAIERWFYANARGLMLNRAAVEASLAGEEGGSS
jgi:hypothetical protein